MNEKIAHQIEKMKKQTIGVEVEMNNIKRDKAARLAADFFGTGRYENTASRNGYMTWSAWDEQGREWKFQKDVSIAGDDAHKCEMVTPILKYEDMETLQELIRKLRKAGTKSDATRGCGVHIHIGAKMSGGQRQRVAAARALILNPRMILADEPTGALDSKNARNIMEKLSGLNCDEQATILMVTHDSNAASFCKRILFIQDGVIFHELRRGDESRQEFYGRILKVMAQLGGGSSNVL